MITAPESRAALTLVVLLWCVPAAPGEGPAASDRPPIPLRQPPLQTPIEAAGAGIEPSVTVEVVVDDRGRVTDVRISRIDPSTEYDEHFVEATRETLMQWRYAPAVEQGVPVARTLTWTVEFPSIEDQGRIRNERSTPIWQLGRSSDVDPLDRERLKILALSEKRRLEVLQSLVNVAASHMDADRLQRVSSPRFVVFTDYDTADTSEKIAQNLEATFTVVDDVFGDVIVPRSERYKIVALAFASGDDYRAMTRDVQSFDWSAGFYNPAGMIAFHLESANRATIATMIHEGIHAYVDRHLTRSGVALPRWLGEGLAEYFANSRIRKGELLPGQTSPGSFQMTPWGVFRFDSIARLTLDDIRFAMNKGKAPTVEDILTAGPGTFYGPDRHMYYALSWLLVHFLRHGREAWAEDEFRDFLLYVAEGYAPLDAFETVYGGTATGFQDEFRRHVQKM